MGPRSSRACRATACRARRTPRRPRSSGSDALRPAWPVSASSGTGTRTRGTQSPPPITFSLTDPVPDPAPDTEPAAAASCDDLLSTDRPCRVSPRPSLSSTATRKASSSSDRPCVVSLSATPERRGRAVHSSLILHPSALRDLSFPCCPCPCPCPHPHPQTRRCLRGDLVPSPSLPSCSVHGLGRHSLDQQAPLPVSLSPSRSFPWVPPSPDSASDMWRRWHLYSHAYPYAATPSPASSCGLRLSDLALPSPPSPSTRCCAHVQRRVSPCCRSCRRTCCTVM